MKRWIAGVCLCFSLAVGAAQEDEAGKANALYADGDRLAALPLYEELAKANPKESVYPQRIALCLYAQSKDVKDADARQKLTERVVAEAKTAVALGSTEDAMQVIATFDLSKLAGKEPTTLAQAIWMSGEPFFGPGKYPEALKRYATAAELEPNVYEPALFSGDAAQRMGDLALAARWYKKATIIQPNYGKAYAHWGEAIYFLGHDSDGAKAKFEDAVVANPYDGQGWQDLQRWTQAQKAILLPPRFKIPNGGGELLKVLGDKKSGHFWGVYEGDRMAYQMGRSDGKPSSIGRFKDDHPGEEKYRPSLAEESKALHAALDFMAGESIDEKNLDDGMRDLIAVNKAGMLDCFILIHGADQGIAQDYIAYRKEHAQLLHDYIDRFVIHGGISSAQ